MSLPPVMLAIDKYISIGLGSVSSTIKELVKKY